MSETQYQYDDRIETTSTPQFEVESQLMENFRTAGIAKLGSDIYPVAQPDGLPWIFSLSDDHKVMLSRPSANRNESFESQAVLSADKQQNVMWADRFQGQNFVVLSGTRDNGYTDLLLYRFTDETADSTRVLLNGFTKPTKIERLFGREINGVYYLGMVCSAFHEALLEGAPYRVFVYTLSSLNEGSSPVFWKQPVDALHQDFGVNAEGHVGLFSMVTPQVFSRKANGYEGVYRTDGNKKKIGDLSVFSAKDLEGHARPGDLGESGKLDWPSGDIDMITAVEKPGSDRKILVHPDKFEVAYKDKDTSGHNPYAVDSDHKDGQLFKLKYNDAHYKALGYAGGGYQNSKLGQSGVHPNKEDYFMVHQDWLKPGVNFIPKPDVECQQEPKEGKEREESCNANMIWGAHHTDSQDHVTAHRVTTENGVLPSGNLFTVHSSTKENEHDTYLLDQEVSNKKSYLYFVPLPARSSVGYGVIDTQQEIVCDVEMCCRDMAVYQAESMATRLFILDWSGQIRMVEQQTKDQAKTSLVGEGHHAFTKIWPVQMPDGRVEIYALGEDENQHGSLYYAQMKENGEWSDFEQITGHEEVEVLSASVMTGSSGNSCFFTTVSEAIMTTHFDPADQGLRFIPLNIHQEENLQSFTSFNVEFNLNTNYGMALPGAVVEVWSETSFSAIANGAPFLLSDKHRTIKTLADGKITLTVEAYDITAPTVCLHLPEYMEAEEYITVEPNAHIREKLEGIDANGLAQAEKNELSSEPEPLLGEDYRNSEEHLDALAQGINKAFELIPEEPVTNDLYLGKATAKRRHARYYNSKPRLPHGMIDLNRVKEQHWMLDFSGDRPRFVTLTREEAQAKIKEITVQMAKGKGSNTWDVSWGSAMHSLKNGLKDMGQFIVSAAEGTISVLIEGIEKLGEGFSQWFQHEIKHIQQVYDAVQSFFASVDAYFEDLVQWLGYLFNWSDITRTHEAIAYSVNEVLDVMPLVADKFKQGIDDEFGHLVQTVKDAADGLRSKIDTSFGHQSQNTVAPVDIGGSDKHNVAMNGLKANAHKAEMSHELQPEAEGLLQRIAILLEENDALKEFSSAQKKIEEAMGNREEAFSLLLSALVDILEGLAEVTLAITQGLIDIFFDILEDTLRLIKLLLNQPIHIPYISELFKRISSDEDLTMLNLIALVIAVPATPLIKAVTGKTPFATADEVEAFKDSFDLLDRRKSKVSPRKVMAKDSFVPEHPTWFFYVISVVTAAQIPVNAYLDMRPLSMVPSGEGSSTAAPTEPDETTSLLGGKKATELTNAANWVDTFFSVVCVSMDITIQAFAVPANNIKTFIKDPELDIKKYSKSVGWFLGWIPIVLDIKSIYSDGTTAGLASLNKTLLKCSISFWLILFRLWQLYNGKILALDATNKILWRLSKFLKVMKLNVEWLPIYTGVHAVGGAIHSIGALKDAYDQEQALAANE